MKSLIKNNKIILLCVFLPLLFIAQYYFFKMGIISPIIKGINIKIIEGAYIQDIDKYVVKMGDEVVLSAGDYLKIPMYAKDPKIKFSILDNSKTVKLENNFNKEKDTVILKALKKGYTSVAVMKNSRVLQKVTILVVDPEVESLNISLNKNLKYVGDEAQISSFVEVDYEEFNHTYKVTYESSNENVLKIVGNKVKAIGVGRATIYAKSKDKVEAIRLNIVARVKNIEIDNNFEISVGEAIKLNPKIITSPKNLKSPKISYKFSQSKLPVQRSVTFDDDGTIVGIREGVEKITISCGQGENKRIEVVTINVKESPLENSAIRNLVAKSNIDGNKLHINLSWDILNGATNYDIYIKDNLIKNSKYELYESISEKKYLKNSDILITMDLKEDIKEVNYNIYVVGRNGEGTSKPSNMEIIKEDLTKKENQDNNKDDEHSHEEEAKDNNQEQEKEEGEKQN